MPQIGAVEVEAGCTTQVLEVQVEVAAAAAMTCAGTVFEVRLGLVLLFDDLVDPESSSDGRSASRVQSDSPWLLCPIDVDGNGCITFCGVYCRELICLLGVLRSLIQSAPTILLLIWCRSVARKAFTFTGHDLSRGLALRILS